MAPPIDAPPIDASPIDASPADPTPCEAPSEALWAAITASHRNRLNALEMLLRSRRTTDCALRDHYARLSQLWLALAERGEQITDVVAHPGTHPGAYPGNER